MELIYLTQGGKLSAVTYYSFYVLALFVFISVSFSALHHILLFIAGSYFTFLNIKRHNILKKSGSYYALLALIIISIISILLNPIEHPLKHLLKLKYYIIPLLGYSAITYWFKHHYNPKKISLLIHSFLISTTIASTSGLIALASGFNPLKFKKACHATRACGMYGMYMTYAYGIIFVVLISLGLYIYRDHVKKLVNHKIVLLSLIVNGLGFLLSFARGSYLGFFAALPFLLFSKSKRLGFISLLLPLLLSATLLIPQVRHELFNKSRTSSIQVRLSQYKAAFYAFKEHPLFGIGYKNFEANSKQIKRRYHIAHEGFGGHAHSNFFEHLASTGILGLIALLLFHFFWGKELLQRKDLLGTILFPCVIALFISGQFQYSFGDGENSFLIMALWLISQVKNPAAE